MADFREKAEIVKRPKNYVVSAVDELRELTSPVRVQITQIMAEKGECSVGELALVMGREPETLYYHIRALLKVGLIVECGARATVRHDEAIYCLRAEQIWLDRERRDEEFLALKAKALRTSLRLFEREMVASLPMPETTLEDDEPSFRMRTSRLRLSAEQRAEFVRRLEDAMQYVDQFRGQETGTQYSILLGVTAIAEEE